MRTGSRRASPRALLAVLALTALAGSFTAADARADDHDRGRQVQERHDDGRREQIQHQRQWRDHDRVYYGGRYYVDPPPAVIYAPPPEPFGLNLMFNLGR
ncbi:MAG TPA: hypothetical protein VKZ79_18885 [Alphaproteobacteria bacterium]|nr:hypothetical protein [Alphaproteobacteria bacterium]